MFTTYILFSPSAKQYYSGSTKDLPNRLREHNSGETTSTRNGVPWTLVWSAQYSTRSEALAVERKIKSRGAARFLQDLRDKQTE